MLFSWQADAEQEKQGRLGKDILVPILITCSSCLSIDLGRRQRHRSALLKSCFHFNPSFLRRPKSRNSNLGLKQCGFSKRRFSELQCHHKTTQSMMKSCHWCHISLFVSYVFIAVTSGKSISCLKWKTLHFYVCKNINWSKLCSQLLFYRA